MINNKVLETQVFEKAQFVLSQLISPAFARSVSLEALDDLITDNLIIRLRCYMLKKQLPDEIEAYQSVPRSLWDHFKLKVFPRWIERRWPARIDNIPIVIRRYNVCPHIVDGTDHNKHVVFLITDPHESFKA